jgi:hypothetical protein
LHFKRREVINASELDQLDTFLIVNCSIPKKGLLDSQAGNVPYDRSKSTPSKPVAFNPSTNEPAVTPRLGDSYTNY